MKIRLLQPAPPGIDNGNRVTADRWRGILTGLGHEVLEGEGPAADVSVVLHAMKGREAILRLKVTEPRGPVIVALTGTDLYRDLVATPDPVLESLTAADRIVVLQEQAVAALPATVRDKVVVIHQSAPAAVPLPRSHGGMRVAMVGHIRREKDPLTAIRALRQLADPTVHLIHAGRILEPELGREIEAAAAAGSGYEWRGPLGREATRDLIRASDVVVHPSVMEGGANVLVEAMTAGIPVLVSDAPGNIGMVGQDHPGIFPVGDFAALAGLMGRARDATWLAGLAAASRSRSVLFRPEIEASAWDRLLRDL